MGDEKSSSSNVMASRDREPRDRASHSAGGLRRRRCIVQTLLVFLLLPAHRPRDVFQSCWELGIKKVHEMCDPISNSDHFLYHVVVSSLKSKICTEKWKQKGGYIGKKVDKIQKTKNVGSEESEKRIIMDDKSDASPIRAGLPDEFLRKKKHRCLCISERRYGLLELQVT
ncbi:unnamed protein product [Malus baccata var. baccata]